MSSRESSLEGGRPARTEIDRLSARETEVLCWAMEGKTNWEISVILSLSERTVKFHIRNAMTKLKASTRAHAVAVAIRRGLIPTDMLDIA